MARLRGASISSLLGERRDPLGDEIQKTLTELKWPGRRSLDARTMCRNLGLDVDNEHWETAGVDDFIRLAYAEGWKACEFRLASPNMADDIAQAIGDPGSILARETDESIPHWSVRAVQHAVAYGVPR